MRLSRILIFSGLSLLLICSSSIKGQPILVRLGIYDFTDITAREFYLLAPVIIAGGDVWKESRLSLNLSAGFGYNSVKYNEHRHHLYIVPILLTMNYDLPNPDAKIWPVIGGGLSLFGKADSNKDLDKIHYGITYGFHANGRLNIALKKNFFFTIDIGYNFLMPPANEELDLSGFISSVGMRIPVARKE